MRCNKIITNITGRPTIKGSAKKGEPLPGRVENLPENEESQKPKKSVSWRSPINKVKCYRAVKSDKA